MATPAEILDGLAQLGDAVDSVSDDLLATLQGSQRTHASFSEDLLSLRDLKQIESDYKKRYERLRDERKRYEAEVYEFMTHNKIEGHKTDGSNFVPTETTFGQVQDLTEFEKWAEANDPSLLKVEARDGEVNRLVRRCIDNGEPLPPGLGFYVREYISTRAG